MDKVMKGTYKPIFHWLPKTAVDKIVTRPSQYSTLYLGLSVNEYAQFQSMDDFTLHAIFQDIFWPTSYKQRSEKSIK